MNELVQERVDEFLRGISKKDKVCIVHDTDSDGICSALIIAKAIERLRGKKIDVRIPLDKKKYGFTPKMLQTIKKKKVTKLITTDFSAEENPSIVKKLEKKCELLIIDHHKLYHDVTSARTILYKPQFFSKVDPPRYCTAKLAYDAANRVVDATDLDWAAAAACIADIATEPWKEWLDGVFARYGVERAPDLFNTKLGEVSAIVSSAEVFDIKLVPRCFEIFYRAKGPEDILHSKLGKYKKIIDKELKKHLELFETRAQQYGETFLYEMTSKWRIHSPLSTILGLKYPHRTILIINTTHPFISVSARRGDKVIPVNNLLERAIEGFQGANAGGHAPAAGAGFEKKYLKTFKERVIAWTQSSSQ